MICTEGDLINHAGDDLRRGRPVDDWDSSAWLAASEYREGEELDDVLQEPLNVYVFSPALRSALEQARIDDVQYLPIHIFDAQGREYPGFSAVNFLNVQPILDLTRSVYELVGPDRPGRAGELRDLRKAVLRAEPLNAHDIAVPREMPYAVFVSQRFRDTFTRGAFTGLSFNRVGVSARDTASQV